jgi:hypothetical protein
VPEPATYVYCLVQAARPPALTGAPPGIPGCGPPRALSVGRDIWAIVADAPLEHFSGERFQQELQDLEAISRHALAHASMVEYCFERAPVIPLKLFTLFSRDERARRQLAARGARLRTLFARLRGFEEWGVRITAGRTQDADSRPQPASGRDYLRAKKQLKDDQERVSPKVAREMAAALTELRSLAAKTRKESFPRPANGRPYVVGASFLVKAKRRAAFTKRVARVEASLAARGHRLDVSGPWPPYRFTSGSGRSIA